MTSSWRHFRVVVKKSYGTFPPSFKMIRHSLVCFLKIAFLMTSSWRHFRVAVRKSCGTFPLSFKMIRHSLICYLENRVFDDVIMTSPKFSRNINIYSFSVTLYKKNFENILFCSKVTCKTSIKSQNLNNS